MQQLLLKKPSAYRAPRDIYKERGWLEGSKKGIETAGINPPKGSRKVK